jgi:hypothetical protein
MALAKYLKCLAQWQILRPRTLIIGQDAPQAYACPRIPALWYQEEGAGFGNLTIADYGPAAKRFLRWRVPLLEDCLSRREHARAEDHVA